jgi:hypothetical protein
MTNAFRSTIAAVALLWMCAAVPAHAADPVYPPGSLIGFVTPKGFEPATRFPGFEDAKSGASMLILAMPAQAFPDVERQMSKDNIKKQGIVEEKRDTPALPDGKSILITGSQEAEGKKIHKWIFIGQKRDVTGLVVVQVPEEAKDTYSDAAIRTALVTMAVRDSVPMDEQLTLLPIRFDELSGMRPFSLALANGKPNGAFLTEGPKDTLDATEQPLMIVSIGAGSPEETGPRETFARNLFTGLAEFKEVRLTGAEMLRLGGGLQTHQLMADAKDAKTDVPMKIVQWVRFGPGVFLRMVGVARADAWGTAFPHFRAVRDGVTPRS